MIKLASGFIDKSEKNSDNSSNVPLNINIEGEEIDFSIPWSSYLQENSQTLETKEEIEKLT